MLFPAPQVKHIQQLVKPLPVHRTAIHQHRQRHILHHVQHRDEVIKLIDQAHLPPAENGQMVLVLGIYVLAVHIHLAGGGPVHAAQNVQQRGLAGPGRPDDGQKLPLFHGKGHVVHRPDLILPLAVYLAEMLDAQNLHMLRLLALLPSVYQAKVTIR